MIPGVRGFRNLDNLFSMIYLKCSDIVIPLLGRAIPDAKKCAELRQHAVDLRHAREEKLRQERCAA